MERVIERCCGLDVHKKTVVACVRVPGGASAREQHVRTFGTTTAELLALRDWLGGYGVTHVAMESTGVYWKPIFYVLEDAFTCVLANAAQIAQVPGRKTDVKEASGLRNCWSMGSCGEALCRQHRSASSEILTRYRAALIGEHTRETNRLQKVLEDAGIKSASVASNVRDLSFAKTRTGGQGLIGG
jgi:transposase